MSELGVYVVYDGNRDRFVLDFRAFSEEKAREEFCVFYRNIVRSDRWEGRTLGRYVLVQLGTVVDGCEVKFPRQRFLMWDDEVRLSWERFLLADPPEDDAALDWLEREFERLDALDAARLARRGNQAA